MSVYSAWWMESLTCIKCVVCPMQQNTADNTIHPRGGGERSRGQAYNHTAPLDQRFS